MDVSIAIRFRESEANCQAIKEMRAVDLIDQKTFTESIKKNMVLYENEWWCVGIETQKWHVFRDGVWIEQLPPYVI